MNEFGVKKGHSVLLEKARTNYDSLEKFAIGKLGSRCIVVQDRPCSWHGLFRESFQRHGLVAGKGAGYAMGEWTSNCVNDAAAVFTEVTGQRLRRSVSRGVFAHSKRRRGDFSDLAAHPSAAIRRARSIAKIRAARA